MRYNFTEAPEFNDPENSKNTNKAFASALFR
jgi:hypothetical protein